MASHKYLKIKHPREKKNGILLFYYDSTIKIKNLFQNIVGNITHSCLGEERPNKTRDPRGS
jgi:hypothetical protein